MACHGVSSLSLLTNISHSACLFLASLLFWGTGLIYLMGKTVTLIPFSEHLAVWQFLPNVSPWVLWTIENVTEFSSKLILQLSVACSSLQWSWRRFLLLMQEPHVRYLCLRLNHKKNVLFPRWVYKCLGGVCPHCCGQPSGFNQDKFDCRPEDDYCRQISCKDYSLTEQPIMQRHHNFKQPMKGMEIGWLWV